MHPKIHFTRSLSSKLRAWPRIIENVGGETGIDHCDHQVSLCHVTRLRHTWWLHPLPTPKRLSLLIRWKPIGFFTYIYIYVRGIVIQEPVFSNTEIMRCVPGFLDSSTKIVIETDFHGLKQTVRTTSLHSKACLKICWCRTQTRYLRRAARCRRAGESNNTNVGTQMSPYIVDTSPHTYKEYIYIV